MKMPVFFIAFIASQNGECSDGKIYHIEEAESISGLIWALVSDIYAPRAIKSNGG